MTFFFDLTVNGLMNGSTYALVALGFVLIYKATSVVNFAQGELVMFGGYVAAALVVLYGLPLAVALPLLLVVMFALGFVIERGVLRPLVGQQVISVVMVTIGLAGVFQGTAAMLWGVQTKNIPLPIPLDPYVIWVTAKNAMQDSKFSVNLFGEEHPVFVAITVREDERSLPSGKMVSQEVLFAYRDRRYAKDPVLEHVKGDIDPIFYHDHARVLTPAPTTS